jgi:hypothetical protein
VSNTNCLTRPTIVICMYMPLGWPVYLSLKRHDAAQEEKSSELREIGVTPIMSSHKFDAGKVDKLCP